MKTGTRVKICGITQVDDAHQAAIAGADAIGIIFYPPSPRYVADLQLARDIAFAVGPFVTATALFVDPEPRWVEQVLKEVPVNLLQFHGAESAAFCEQFSRPYIKALPMKPELDVTQSIKLFGGASAILLDAYQPGKAGGTGATFDWNRVPASAEKPVILAGGLTPDNVIEAIQRTQPYAVDVSGGVEQSVEGRLNHGIKDSTKIADFVRRAKVGETSSE